MTFARKIRWYRFRCIVLACKPAWRYGFTYGRVVTRFSYRALHRGDAAAMLIRGDATEQLCLILVVGDAAERLCLILIRDDARLCPVLVGRYA